jgi:predicted permease
MPWLRVFVARARALLRRDVVAGEIREELQFHFEARVSQYVAEGLSLQDARDKAWRRVGNLSVHQDRGYDVRGGGVMETVWQDVRYAVRMLRKQPGFSAVAILTLALGIGASTAIFTVVDATMLRPLPYPDPEQLVSIYTQVTRPDGRVGSPTPSLADARFWATATDLFSVVATYGSAFRGRIADGAEPERLSVMHISETYLQMHGIAPIAGRDFTRADMDPGAPNVALLGYGYWQSRFGGREDAIGQTIRLDDGIYTIVGILPDWFNRRTPLITPHRIPMEDVDRRGSGRVSVYGRLRPGVTPQQAAERLTALMAHLPAPDGRPAGARVSSRLNAAVAQSATTVRVIAGAVAFILLIGCVNVAGLLLARGAVRQAELAVRASLGAGRGRLIRQVLTESLVLACLGGAGGVLLAWMTLDVLVANLPVSFSSNSPPQMDLRVLVATFALLVPTSLLFGLAPALRLSKVRINPILAAHGRYQSSSLSRRGSQWLIALEVAMAVVLVAGAALMLRSFQRLTSVDLGFNPDDLVTMEVLPLDQDPEIHRAYFSSLFPRLRAIPGVTSLGGVDNFVLGSGTSYTSVRVDDTSSAITTFEMHPGYLDTIGAELLDGRLLTTADVDAGARVVVVAESAARTLFGGRAVGRQLVRAGPQVEPWTVIGVIRDLRHGGPQWEEDRPAVFFPTRPPSDLNEATTIVVRSERTASDLADHLRLAAQAVGPRVLIENILSANDRFGDSVLRPRQRTVMLSLLGGLGLVLAVVGVFGMTAYAVARRTREIGVRMAFGARPGEMVRAMLRDAAIPIVLGTVAGLIAAAYATAVIASFLYETDPVDPMTFALVAIVLVVAGCFAALVPATRAARVDPISALRTE